MNIRTILLAVDGSTHGQKASELAGVLASTHGSEVVVLHVLDPKRDTVDHGRAVEVEHRVVDSGPGLPWVANVPANLAAMLAPQTRPEARDTMLEFLANRVVRAATNALEVEGVRDDRIRVLFKDGNPAKRIIETIDEEDVDTVVMGCRGQSNVAGVLMGSVSHHVASRAPCTVVTTR